MCVFAVLAELAISGRCGLAADEFQALVNRIPRSANAVVLLNMEKAKNSPLGLKRGLEGEDREGICLRRGPHTAASGAIRIGFSDRL